LTAAVGISAGVTALVSAFQETKYGPICTSTSWLMCLLILAGIALVNMRGVKETGAVFMLPTFLFVGTLLITIGVGVYHAVTHGHPVALARRRRRTTKLEHLAMAAVFLLLKAFSNGCAAMTGVEAVSNGVTAFKEPRSENANRTLTVIIGILIMLLFGLSYVAKAYGVTAMDPTRTTTRACCRLKCGGVWAAVVLLSDDGRRAGGAELQREHGVCGFSAHGAGDCGKDYLPHVFCCADGGCCSRMASMR
jgi:amino acid transporter